MAVIVRNPPGRSEAFVEIEIQVGDDAVDFDPACLDLAGRKRLHEATGGRSFVALKGVAHIAWKHDTARSACVSDHQENDKRRKRWKQVEQSASRMRKGEFPPHGHVYVVNSSSDEPKAAVIDGTRRMLAYLESGHSQMPVIVLLVEERTP